MPYIWGDDVVKVILIFDLYSEFVRTSLFPLGKPHTSVIYDANNAICTSKYYVHLFVGTLTIRNYCACHTRKYLVWSLEAGEQAIQTSKSSFCDFL